LTGYEALEDELLLLLSGPVCTTCNNQNASYQTSKATNLLFAHNSIRGRCSLILQHANTGEANLRSTKSKPFQPIFCSWLLRNCRRSASERTRCKSARRNDQPSLCAQLHSRVQFRSAAREHLASSKRTQLTESSARNAGRATAKFGGASGLRRCSDKARVETVSHTQLSLHRPTLSEQLLNRWTFASEQNVVSTMAGGRQTNRPSNVG
jgi:hypothetical protein